MVANTTAKASSTKPSVETSEGTDTAPQPHRESAPADEFYDTKENQSLDTKPSKGDAVSLDGTDDGSRSETGSLREQILSLD